MKKGKTFKIVTVSDVKQDGAVAIPAGTPGEGTVVFQKKSGSFGKSGKLEVTFDWLELNGQKIALIGRHRQEGKGNGGVATGAVLAGGIVGGFLIKGKSAAIEPNQKLKAKTANALTFTGAAVKPVAPVVSGTN